MPIKMALSSVITTCLIISTTACITNTSPEVPVFSGRYVGELTIVEPENYFLTNHGNQTFNNYDPNYEDPRQWDDCEPEGVPAILLTPAVATLDIISENKTVLLHYERDDAIRIVNMHNTNSKSDHKSVLGYSKGRWENNILVVETTNLNGGVIIAQTSYPISTNAHVIERYWRENGSADLLMEVVIEDPVNYIQSVIIKRKWIWAPNAPRHPWECVSLGPRHSESLDIESIKQQLEAL
ncbi:MAG: hypothetical protein P8M36_08240 [Gammaproteobacteria bacterium]|nr:hypothetical protein [Gammaproteobacteria bacterium]